MNIIEEIALLLILATFIFTLKGFKSATHFSTYCFSVSRVRIRHEYYRLLSAGFLHGNWRHFSLHMLFLYLFSAGLSNHLSVLAYVTLLISGYVIGQLASLWVVRNEMELREVGSAGAVSALAFAYIILSDTGQLALPILGWEIPTLLLTTSYMLFAIYGLSPIFGNSSVNTHMGGAVAGGIFALIQSPTVLETRSWVIALLLIPTAIFTHNLIQSFKRSSMIHSYVSAYAPQAAQKAAMIAEEPYHDRETEINHLLDEIHKRGLGQLSAAEKMRLDELSQDQ